MQKSSVIVAVVCCFAITAASCMPTPQTADTTQTIKFCPPLLVLGVRPLGCFVFDNHLLGVGNPSATAIPKGTPVSFVAKLVNAGAYCATVPTPEPISAAPVRRYHWATALRRSNTLSGVAGSAARAYAVKGTLGRCSSPSRATATAHSLRRFANRVFQ